MMINESGVDLQSDIIVPSAGFSRYVFIRQVKNWETEETGSEMVSLRGVEG